MEPDLHPRKPRWKAFLLALAVCSALTLLYFLWIGAAADRNWAAMDKVVRTLVTEAVERGRLRPVLYGETQLGNAWDDYTTAAALSRTVLPPLQKNLQTFLRIPDSCDMDSVRRDLQTCGPLITKLRQGAHRASARTPCVDADGLWTQSRPAPMGWPLLALHCQSRLLRRDGHPLEALQSLLDHCQVSLDSGVRYLEDMLNDLMLLLTQEDLPPDTLRILETALERAEQPYNSGQWTGVEYLAHNGSILLRGQGGSYDSWSVWPSWRYGFSLRLQQSNAFLALERLANAQATLSGAALKAFQEDWGTLHFKNRLAGSQYPDYQPERRPWTSDLARIRLLRIGARFRLSGEIKLLQDPWGDLIRHSRDDLGERFWSIGLNMKDDGGIGVFGLPGNADSQPDIVLAIPR